MPEVQIPIPSVPIVDKSGYVAREWRWFFHDILQRIGGLGDIDILFNVVEDLSPQLGANLDRNGFDIVGANDLDLLTFTETVDAVNSINIENAATGNAPIIQATGPAAGIPLRFRSKGGGFIIFLDGNNLELLRLVVTANAVNEITINNATTGNDPSVEATGANTDINLNLISKGTGVVQANGVAVLLNVVEDTTPQLGGDLDLNGNNIDFPTTADISDCLDEDDLVSDSATALATQQSIKAYVDGAGGGDTLPVVDTTAVVKGSADATKLVRIEADGIATGTTRVITMADADVNLTPGTGSFATEAEGTLAASALQSADIGSTVQAHDADTAKTDVAQAWTAAQYSDFTALTSGTNISIDLDTGPNFDVTLAHNATLDNPTNINVGQTGIIAVTQDGTGTRTLAYGSFYKFVGGTTPILSTAAGSEDSLHYFVRSSTLIHVSSALDWS